MKISFILLLSNIFFFIQSFSQLDSVHLKLDKFFNHVNENLILNKYDVRDYITGVSIGADSVNMLNISSVIDVLYYVDESGDTSSFFPYLELKDVDTVLLEKNDTMLKQRYYSYEQMEDSLFRGNDKFLIKKEEFLNGYEVDYIDSLLGYRIVIDEIDSIENYFISICLNVNSESELRSILTYFNNIAVLDGYESASGFNPFPYLPNLKRISCHNKNEVINLLDSNYTPLIEKIDLESCGLKSIPKNILGFKHLKTLDLSRNHIRSTKQLSKLKSLESLDLQYCKGLKISSNIKELTNLKTIYISSSMSNKSLKSLLQNKSLKVIHLNRHYSNVNISKPLWEFDFLDEIHLHGFCKRHTKCSIPTDEALKFKRKMIRHGVKVYLH